MKRNLFVLMWIVGFTLSAFLSTHLFAILIGSPPELGPTHYGPFWQPFHIFWWLYRLQVSGPYYTIAFSLLGVLTLADTIAAIWLYHRADTKTGDTYGTSRWMSNRELKRLGFLEPQGLLFAQKNDAKYSSKPSKTKTGELEWTLKKPAPLIWNNQKEHALVIAATRRGKGIGFAIPSLLVWPESVVVYDVKKENWDLTAAVRRRRSRVIKFEPTNPESVHFNPLFEIEDGPKAVSQAQNLAAVIADPNGDGQWDHWKKTSWQLLTGTILYVLYTQPLEHKTLNGLYRILNNPELSFKDTMQLLIHTQIPDVHPGVVNVIQETGRNMANKPDDEAGSVVSTASTALALYQDPIVAEVTSTSDFSVNDLMEHDDPVSLYLVVSPEEAARLTPLTRLMLQTIGTKLTARLNEPKHKLLMLLDEFPTLGHLEFFEKQLAFFAGYGIRVAAICQSFNQLQKAYGQHTSIPANCRFKLLLGSDDPEEAKLISSYLGQETLTRTSTTRSGNVANFLSKNKSYSEQEVGRSLLTEDEILRLPFDEAILITGGGYPYHAKKIMWFADKRFTSRLKKTKENGWNHPDSPEGMAETPSAAQRQITGLTTDYPWLTREAVPPPSMSDEEEELEETGDDQDEAVAIATDASPAQPAFSGNHEENSSEDEDLSAARPNFNFGTDEAQHDPPLAQEAIDSETSSLHSSPFPNFITPHEEETDNDPAATPENAAAPGAAGDESAAHTEPAGSTDNPYQPPHHNIHDEEPAYEQDADAKNRNASTAEKSSTEDRNAQPDTEQTEWNKDPLPHRTPAKQSTADHKNKPPI